MKNTARDFWVMLPVAAMLLGAAMGLRGAEYDEQYTLFLTAGTPRPVWPEGVFRAGAVAAAQAGVAGPAEIADALRRTDVHPPLYFWAVASWRFAFGPGLAAARGFSVLCGLVSVGLTGLIARRFGVRAWLAMAVLLGCYGFVYTSIVARGFALAEMLLLCGVLSVMRPGTWFGGTASDGLPASRVPAGDGPLGPIADGGVADGKGRSGGERLDGERAAEERWGGERSDGERPGRADSGGERSDGERSGGERSSGASFGNRLAGSGPWGGAPPGGLARVLAGGLLLGAACASNYLAVFVALTVVVLAGAWWALVAMAPFLMLDGWFFVAQHGSRADQFPAFSVLWAMVRLVEYQGAAVLGGLPLYAEGLGRMLVGVAVGAAGVATLGRIRPLADWRLIALVAATPAGLLILGAVFDTTPVELRYLSFGLPFLAVLLARQGASRALCMMLAVQVLGVAGLMLMPRTMQPGQAVARAAAASVGDGVVVVPLGNDGVGVVGAFGIEAPPALPMVLARFSDTPDAIAARVAGYRRVVLALMGQDAASQHALEVMRAAFEGPGWRRVAIGSSVAVYERTDAEE